MPTIVTRYIDPGGGPLCDYAGTQLWEDDFGGVEDGECTTHDQVALGVGISSDGSIDDSGGSSPSGGGVLVAGWTADSTRYPWLWTDPFGGYRHLGWWDDSGSSFRICKPTAQDQIDIRQKYFRCSGVAFKRGAGNQYYGTMHIRTEAVTVEDCVLFGNTLEGAGPYLYGINSYQFTGTGLPNVYRNCLAYGYGGTDSIGFRIKGITGGTLTYHHNCLSVSNDRGFYRDGASGLVSNCGTFNTFSLAYSAGMGGSNNAYDIGSDPNTDGVDISGVDDSLLFEDYDNSNFRLANVSGNPLLQTGANLFAHSVNPVTSDILGAARYEEDIGFDIGPWQVSAPEDPVDNNSIYYRKARRRRVRRYFFLAKRR